MKNRRIYYHNLQDNAPLIEQKIWRIWKYRLWIYLKIPKFRMCINSLLNEKVGVSMLGDLFCDVLSDEILKWL